MRRLMERELYSPLLAGAEADGWALYRLTDLSVGRKPFDIGGCDNDGLAVAIECKVIDRLDFSAPMPKIFETHQRNWLTAFARRGGRALAILTFRQGGPIWVCEPPIARTLTAAVWEQLPLQGWHVSELRLMPGPGYRGWPRRR